eukprot:scpid55644/ scgid6157/ 
MLTQFNHETLPQLRTITVRMYLTRRSVFFSHPLHAQFHHQTFSSAALAHTIFVYSCLVYFLMNMNFLPLLIFQEKNVVTRHNFKSLCHFSDSGDTPCMPVLYDCDYCRWCMIALDCAAVAGTAGSVPRRQLLCRLMRRENADLLRLCCVCLLGGGGVLSSVGWSPCCCRSSLRLIERGNSGWLGRGLDGDDGCSTSRLADLLLSLCRTPDSDFLLFSLLSFAFGGASLKWYAGDNIQQ